MEKAFAARGLAFKEQVILGSREAVKAALSVGYGISIMPKSAVDRSDKSGFLVTKNIRNLDLKFPINIVYHKDKHLSRLAAAFLEFLRKLPSLRSRP
jgi:DNA-binding transcriptional LysR family regulator